MTYATADEDDPVRGTDWPELYEEVCEANDALLERLALAEAVVEAAVEVQGECRLAPDSAKGRQWCVRHQEWTPCPFVDLAAALAAYREEEG